MKREKYDFATLRFVYDLATEEFLTVGTVIYSPQNDFLKFKFRRNLGLAGDLFTSDETQNFRALMRVISKHANKIEQSLKKNLLNCATPLDQKLLDLIPKDDSALQWSSISSGLTKDLEATYNRLYARYCGKYDHTPRKTRVTDSDALRNLHNKLVDKKLDDYFIPKDINGSIENVQFPFAWKNGIWHCLEPISFDLANNQSIRDKAHRHVGEISSIRDSNEKFAVYFVATPPKSSNPELTSAFDKALELLYAAPHDNIDVVTASDADSLLDEFAAQIRSVNSTNGTNILSD